MIPVEHTTDQQFAEACIQDVFVVRGMVECIYAHQSFQQRFAGDWEDFRRCSLVDHPCCYWWLSSFRSDSCNIQVVLVSASSLDRKFPCRLVVTISRQSTIVSLICKWWDDVRPVKRVLVYLLVNDCRSWMVTIENPCRMCLLRRSSNGCAFVRPFDGGVKDALRRRLAM